VGNYLHHFCGVPNMCDHWGSPPCAGKRWPVRIAPERRSRFGAETMNARKCREDIIGNPPHSASARGRHCDGFVMASALCLSAGSPALVGCPGPARSWGRRRA